LETKNLKRKLYIEAAGMDSEIESELKKAEARRTSPEEGNKQPA